MEKHLYILKQLLVYCYESQGWILIAEYIKKENETGNSFIKNQINSFLK
jgi:hypothetical protein